MSEGKLALTKFVCLDIGCHHRNLLDSEHAAALQSSRIEFGGELDANRAARDHCRYMELKKGEGEVRWVAVK